MHNTAKIEKEEVCHLVAERVIQGGTTLFHLLIFIIHIVPLYKEDCAIMRISWAVGSVALTRTEQIVSHMIFKMSGNTV